jgi:diguanylate cyclase (GGDEF)-like protein
MTTYLPVTYDPQLVALSMLLAVFSTFVALQLTGRMSAAGTRPGRWLTAGAVSMGSGLWGMHFVAVLARDIPVTLGYAAGPTALSWLLGVSSAGLAFWLARGSRLTGWRLAAGAAAVGAGLCLMHYVGMAALHMQPAIVWNGWLVAASVAVAIAGSAVLLTVFCSLRQHNVELGQPLALQGAAALMMGLTIVGMHFTGMAAAQFPADTVGLAATEVSRHWLGVTVSLATFALLLITLVVCILDARIDARTRGLQKSLEEADQELKNIAFQDPLTRLANRRRFEDSLRRTCIQAAQHGHKTAVLFVGLDSFKAINDVFGHRSGDEVLRVVGRRLAEDLRGSDTVARLGGDEFVILLERVDQQEAAETLARRILRTVEQPVGLNGREIALSASIGIAFFPDDGEHDRLIANADVAMHSAKQAGRATYRFYSPQMDAGMRESILIQRDLRLALERDEFELVYQAKVDARSGRPTSTEALIRWNHPERGRVSPGEFIPIAEKSGLIVQIGNWVLHRAVAQMAEWMAQGLRIPVAINLSGQHFQDPELPRIIQAALDAYDVDPSMLTLEITETAAMNDAEETLRVLSSLAGIGVQISIDDFGTGYSSLAYLRRFHALQIKIDRSFIADIEESEDARSVIQAVINLAHALQRQVVAEGVETPAQALYLKQHGCDELQGFLFSRPGPVQAMYDFFAEPAERSVA